MSDATELGPDAGLARVREGVMGAPVAPFLAVIEGGGGGAKGGDPRPAVGGGGGDAGGAAEADTPEGACPLVCLGHIDGVFVFLDIVGQRRELKARALTSRGDLVGLFLGDTGWLFRWFPNIVKVTRMEGDKKVEVEEVRGFSVSKAGEFLMSMCRRAGLFGSHVVLRGPGVWAAEDGAPVVHAGDVVMIGGGWRATGFRDGNQVWISAHRRARPGVDIDGRALLPGEDGFAAPAITGQDLERGISDLWNFRLGGSERICIGLMVVGYFGTAARWRPNGYLIGGTGSGKSMLLLLLKACVPASEYSTDTSKAGIEGAINGKPTPVYLDEAGDRQGHGAQVLLDVVLSASGGDGTRGLRGSADGGSRSFQAACSVIMAAVSPPTMGPQHRDRFTLVHLIKPGEGADNRADMEALTAWCADRAPLLWGRAIEGWPRWLAALPAFREALAASHCAPREMDQMGAILAGWWVLCRDGVPSPEDAADCVLSVAAFIRGAEAVAADDGPRRVVQFLASSVVQRDRSTDIEQIGVLVDRAFDGGQMDREPAQRLLERFGIRVVRASDAKTVNGKVIPRGDLGDGMWFARSAETLRKLFAGSAFEGDRWMYELARHPSAVESRKTVRVAGALGPAIWIGRGDWSPPGEDEGGEVAENPP